MRCRALRQGDGKIRGAARWPAIVVLWLILPGPAAAMGKSSQPEMNGLRDLPVDLFDGLKPYMQLKPYYKITPPIRKFLKHSSRYRARKALSEISRMLKNPAYRKERPQLYFLMARIARVLRKKRLEKDCLVRALRSYPRMKDEIAYRLGLMALADRNHSLAATILEQVPRWSPLHLRARKEWARALTRSFRPDVAARTIEKHLNQHHLYPENGPEWPSLKALEDAKRQVLKHPRKKGPGPLSRAVRAELTFLCAELYMRARKFSKAAAIYRRLWSRHPRSRFARKAKARLRKLKKRIGKGAGLGLRDLLFRAQVLLAAGHSRSALGYFRKLSRLLRRKSAKRLFRDRVQFGLALAYFERGLHRKAMRMFRKLSADASTMALRARALFRWAECLKRRRRIDKALGHFAAVAMRYPKSMRAADALYLSAFCARRYGHHDKARKLFGQLAEFYPESPFANLATWWQSWYAYRKGDFKTAGSGFRKLIRRLPCSLEESRALFWLGRVMERSGQNATLIYKKITEIYSHNLYSHLADLRLKVNPAQDAGAYDDIFDAIGDNRLYPREAFKEPRLLKAAEWLRLGFRKEALKLLRKIEYDNNLTEPMALVMAQIHLGIKSLRRTYWILRRTSYPFSYYRPSSRFHQMSRTSYPKRFAGGVISAARRNRLNPALLFALIREESSFHPRAVSPREAYGLTQVIMATALDMARELKLKRPKPRDLFRPSLNLALGARFLRKLIRYYRNRPLLALAAYNAGPGNVNKWLQKRGFHNKGPVPIGEFVEEIPFEETYKYVLNVYRSLSAYHLLYGKYLAQKMKRRGYRKRGRSRRHYRTRKRRGRTLSKLSRITRR